MRLKTLLVVVALAVCVSVSAPKTFAQNLLTNGSFETGDFTGWNTGGNFEDTEVVSGAFDQYTGAEDGNFYVVMGPVGSDGTMGQTFSDHAGTQYRSVSGLPLLATIPATLVPIGMALQF